MSGEKAFYDFHVTLGGGEPAYLACLPARDEADAAARARRAMLQSWRAVLAPMGVREEPDAGMLAPSEIREGPVMGSGTRRILPPMSAALGRISAAHRDAGKPFRTIRPWITEMPRDQAERILGLCAEAGALQWGWRPGVESYVLSVSSAVEASGPWLCDTLTIQGRAEYDGGATMGDIRLTGRIARAVAAVAARLNGAGHLRTVQRHVWARVSPPASASARAADAMMAGRRSKDASGAIASFLREVGDHETAREFALEKDGQDRE